MIWETLVPCRAAENPPTKPAGMMSVGDLRGYGLILTSVSCAGEPSAARPPIRSARVQAPPDSRTRPSSDSTTGWAASSTAAGLGRDLRLWGTTREVMGVILRMI